MKGNNMPLPPSDCGAPYIPTPEEIAVGKEKLKAEARARKQTGNRKRGTHREHLCQATPKLAPPENLIDNYVGNPKEGAI
jgi:hypothetical protein